MGKGCHHKDVSFFHAKKYTCAFVMGNFLKSRAITQEYPTYHAYPLVCKVIKIRRNAMNTQMYMMPNQNYLPREQTLYNPNDLDHLGLDLVPHSLVRLVLECLLDSGSVCRFLEVTHFSSNQ
jgi:hypothetical protein